MSTTEKKPTTTIQAEGWLSLPWVPTTNSKEINARVDEHGLTLRFPVDAHQAQPGLVGEVRVGPTGLVSMRVRADHDGAVWFAPDPEQAEVERVLNSAARYLAQFAASLWNEVDDI